MHLDEDVISALEKAAAEEEKAGSKRGGLEEQNGRAAEGDPGREERRLIRRRRKLGLKAALLGRSRGGQISKVHLAADRKCRLLAFVLTAGQVADSPQFIPVLGKARVRGSVGRPRTRPDAVAGDKAYASRGNRAHLCRRGIKAVIPEKRDRAANRKKKGSRGGRPVSHDADPYKERNTVERLINKLKAWRGTATRYDKTPDSYLAGLHLRASMIWIKDLTRTAHRSRLDTRPRRLMKILLRGCPAVGRASPLVYAVAGLIVQVLPVRVSPRLISRRRLRAAARVWSQGLLARVPR
jgi:transposase